jgi:ribosomal protein L25 (general stress protein Ctc)
VAKLAGKEPGSNWCSRFVERHKAELDSRYLNSLDLQRHHADSVAKYEQYFDTVRSKMREYDIRPEDCYNMDEKGSHVTLPFLEQAYKHRILVAVYPPHATHGLQPLDVGCFAPLATYYSQNLEQVTIDSEGLTRLQKRDFFRLFFLAWHKEFTEKNVVSSWRKAGLFSFDPDVVLSQVRGPKQVSLCQSIANRQLSSSPPICFDSPSVNRRLRKMISRAVDKKTKKWMTQLTEEVLSTRAELTLARIEKRRATEALYQEKKRRKKGKKLMEEFRAQEGASAILFSPSKVQKAIELKERSEQAALDETHEKQLRIQERAAQKALKEQEAQRKRSDRATAAQAKEEANAQKQADRLKAKEAKEAQTRLKEQSKTSVSRSRGRPKKQPKAPVAASKNRELETGEVPKQASSRSGRTITKSTRFRQ